MYAQLFLGIAMLVMASGHWRGKASLIRSGIREVLQGDALRSYQRSLALPYTCLGILFIVMGLVGGKTRGITRSGVYYGVYHSGACAYPMGNPE